MCSFGIGRGGAVICECDANWATRSLNVCFIRELYLENREPVHPCKHMGIAKVRLSLITPCGILERLIPSGSP